MRSLDLRERDLVKCEDMRIHAERACQFLGPRSLAEFASDQLIQAAVIRCLEVIGEAARQVSGDTRQRSPEIPWPLIVGMRNVLAHNYGTVDLERIHRVVTDDLPALIKSLGHLIAALEREVGWRDDSGS
jgi:uncharacterized protein with HEPN domain